MTSSICISYNHINTLHRSITWAAELFDICPFDFWILLRIAAFLDTVLLFIVSTPLRLFNVNVNLDTLYEWSTYTGNLTAMLVLIVSKLDCLEGIEFPYV